MDLLWIFYDFIHLSINFPKKFYKIYGFFMDYFMDKFMDFLWKFCGLFCSQFQTFKLRPCLHLTLPTLQPYSLGLKIATGLTAAAA